MSKGLSFFLGIVTGILLTLGYFVVKANTGEKKGKIPNGITKLETPIPFTEARNFEVIQVVSVDAALAHSEKKYWDSVYYTDPVVLIIADQKNSFYDNQIVKAPKDCKVMQVGTYSYQSSLGPKTVPIIRFVKTK